MGSGRCTSGMVSNSSVVQGANIGPRRGGKCPIPPLPMSGSDNTPQTPHFGLSLRCSFLKGNQVTGPAGISCDERSRIFIGSCNATPRACLVGPHSASAPTIPTTFNCNVKTLVLPLLTLCRPKRVSFTRRRRTRTEGLRTVTPTQEQE